MGKTWRFDADGVLQPEPSHPADCDCFDCMERDGRIAAAWREDPQMQIPTEPVLPVVLLVEEDEDE
jgi:hypothetical protein